MNRKHVLPSPLRRAAGFTPLVLSLAVCHAYGADLVRVGRAGQNGADATVPGAAGGAGQAGQSLTVNPLNAGVLYNRLTLTGGRGGNGGAGAALEEYVSGDGGSGGRGGDASGTVVDITGYAGATVLGGRGGDAGRSAEEYSFNPEDPAHGVGGDGGAASSTARSATAGNATAAAVSVGGAGGIGQGGWYGYGGAGGAASATAHAASLFGNASASAEATGGNGGNGIGVTWRGGKGGDVALVNAVSGSTAGRLTLSQRATGGDGGANEAYNISPLESLAADNRGGNASSTLVLDDRTASALTANVVSLGGRAGDGFQSVDWVNAGGAATSTLNLTSGRSGAAIDGHVTAIGGEGGEVPRYGGLGGDGGAANASSVLSGKAAVAGQVTATGGAAAGVAGRGGAAVAQLSATGPGVVRGRVDASGGRGRADAPGVFRQDGVATATLQLNGAGALGGSYSTGSSATSTTTVLTNGQLAVDVVAHALAGELGVNPLGAAIANTSVDTTSGAGTAAVRAAATALGGDGAQNATATTDVRAGGHVTVTSDAVGGYANFRVAPIASGDAVSVARGVTSGNHNASVTATALSEIGDVDGSRSWFGNAAADAYGRSGRGAVDVLAVARGGLYLNASGVANVSARAAAVTVEAGGTSVARARGAGLNLDLQASAQAVAARGNVTFTAHAASAQVADGQVSAASQFRSEAFSLPPAGAGLIAHVGAAPTSPAVLGLGAHVAAGIPALQGTGVQGAAYDPANDAAPVVQTTSGEFQFDTDSAQRLLIGFVSSSFSGAGFDVLDLTVSNNGVALLSQSFTSLSAANLFFNDHVVDLGLFGAGVQHVVITSSVSFAQQSAYAFNYVLGSGLVGGSPVGGGGIAPVPEPSTWMMLSVGALSMLLIARRRRRTFA